MGIILIADLYSFHENIIVDHMVDIIINVLNMQSVKYHLWKQF